MSMENIKSQLDKITYMLEQVDDILDAAKASPFSGKKVTLDREELNNVIDDIKHIVSELSNKGLASEFVNVRRIIGDRDNIVSSAEHKAKLIIEEAQKEAALILSDNEIVLQAKEVAANLENATRKRLDEAEDTVIAGVADMADSIIATLQDTYDAQVRQARETEVFHAKAEAVYLELLEDIRHYRASLRNR